MKITTFLFPLLLALPLSVAVGLGQSIAPAAPADATKARSEEITQLRAELARLSARLDALEGSGATPGSKATDTAAEGDLAARNVPPVITAGAASVGVSSSNAAPALSAAATPFSPAAPARQPAPPSALTSALPAILPGGVTLNYTFDGYYGFDFNQPRAA